MNVRYLIRTDTENALRRLSLTRRPVGVARGIGLVCITLDLSRGEWLRPHRTDTSAVTLCADDGIWSMPGVLLSMDEIGPACVEVEPPRYRFTNSEAR